MPLDTSIPLQYQQVNPMQSLSSVLNVGNQAQALKNAQLANEQGQVGLQDTQMSLRERQAAAGVLKNIKQYQDGQGNVDYNKLMPDVMAVAPTTGHEIVRGVFNAQHSATEARSAVTSLDQKQRELIGNALYSMKGKDPMEVHNFMEGIKEHYPSMSPAVDFMGKYILGPQVRDRAGFDTALDSAGRFVQGAPTQQGMQTPDGVQVNNGQQSYVVSTKPGTTVAQGQALPGTYTQLQPGPGTPVIRNGVPSIYGAQAPLQPGDATPQTSYAPGQAEGVAGPVAVNNQHYQTVQQEAAPAATRIAALQTIREQIPQALMGGGGVGDMLRKMYSVFGLGDNKTATANDVMAKNLALLASQSGATDAARTFGEMQNPNAHITKEAAQKAASEMMGIEMKKQAAASYFSGVQTNSSEYASRMNMWNKYGDPRAFEFASLPPEGRAHMRAEMKKAGTWDKLRNNIEHLHMMGVSPE